MTDISVARCSEHGLHGERNECFVCGGPVEQVKMVEREEHERRVERAYILGWERSSEGFNSEYSGSMVYGGVPDAIKRAAKRYAKKRT